MKIVLALAAFVALCSGHAIPSVPGDNSEYVEGESRYIWMPDGEGNSHLVDLQEPIDEALLNARNGANNQYWLFTRSNQNSRQILTNGNINSVRNSNYASNKAIKVIVHGWKDNGDSHVNTVIRQAFLAVQDVNVIVVDWRSLAGSSYNTAARGAPGIGQHLGNFLVWLINNAGGNWNNVHLVGHSLGAHIVGSAGRQAGGRPSRVTGLDAAGPGWGSGNSNTLSRNAGRYVEAIHTDGNVLGLMNVIGDTDFYPNGGKHPQPGCSILSNSCSHARVLDLFASTIRHNRFTARRCNNIREAEQVNCSGSNLNMGNAVINKSGSAKVSDIMKIVLALAALAALSHALPAVPVDNSHYVEGESRYIWMPDGEGNSHLVDLHEPVDEALLNSRNGANNQYWLFTRSNQNSAQILVNGNINSVRNSNYASNKGIKVIVHGWNNNGGSPVNVAIRQAFLAVQDVNVIVVDWRGLASSSYTSAAGGVPSVGQHIGNFLVWLINNAGGNWNNVHLVGHSLGAHIVGVAGRQAGGRPSRVTGLDAAGPGWSSNSNALNRNAGRYVEAIHTDGNILGLMNPIADVDFYPNGGRHPQPGCPGGINSSCSHGRAFEFFASTIRHNRFTGRQCSNLSQAQNVNCSGGNLNMGNAQINKSGSGIYALRTGSSWPF
ncbi:uncharacterized protein LOC113496789 [Trichoplusia ni]|uniref:Uncharacterized protein LOC113496789 n=1 Tax=Trichoplusia ni TaxID=7111 RepID=A0A7E5VU96_TRINI|nr:uncharacterized protein LOC113496789 [Trichoplusia ni]